MSNIWLISDTHFNHNQPFLYEPRGFATVEEMNEAIIERWNSLVKPEDTVVERDKINPDDETKFWWLGPSAIAELFAEEQARMTRQT